MVPSLRSIALSAALLSVLSAAFVTEAMIPAPFAAASRNVVAVSGAAMSGPHSAATLRRAVPLYRVRRGASLMAAATLLAVADQPDIRPRDRALLSEVLIALPSLCRDNLRSLYVRYNDSDRRGLGGASTIIISRSSSTSDLEFQKLVGHECGHVASLGGMRGTAGAGTTAYFDGNQPIYADSRAMGFYQLSWQTANRRWPDSSDSDFVSGYAKTDIFEDFAETFALYAFNRAAFQTMTQTSPVLLLKYRWMEQNVFGGGRMIAMGSSYAPPSAAFRPWDVTKLP